MVFGSPENMLWHLLSMDFSCFYHGGQPGTGAPENIHVMSKLPDGQAAAEKAAIMALGAALGRAALALPVCSAWMRFSAPNSSYSTAKSVIGCRRAGSRCVVGRRGGRTIGWKRCAPGWQAASCGLTAPSIITVPRPGTRVGSPGAIGSWISEGQPQLGERLRAEARRRIAAHDFELDTDRRRGIERIFQAAKAAVG